MLTLTTLGGLALSADGRELGGVVSQRRPMAVLAILAAAGGAAVGRERLAGLLWGDADEERARRSLAQALYTLRKSTGQEELVTGVTDLRLNPAVVGSDLAAFQQALTAGRLEDAVEIYQGPFLDGFSVPGAADLERWIEAERLQLARRHADTLQTLARRAEDAGVLDDALRLRRRLVALDPLDSPATLALIDVLGRTGDVAGAVRAARIHQRLLQDELELPMPTAIQSRIDALQADAMNVAPAAVGGPDPVTAPQNPASDVPATSVASSGALGSQETVRPAAPVSPPDVTHTARWRRRAVHMGVLGIAAIGLLATGVLVGRGGVRAPAPASATRLQSDVFAVVPFSTDSAEPALAYLGEGVADALGRMLSGGIGPRAVDPATVVATVDRFRSGTAAIPDPRERALAAARVLSAGEVMMGRVTGTAHRLTLTASLVDVASRERRAVASVNGPVDSLPAMLDGLAARLLTGRNIGVERESAFAGVSFPVLRTYLEAEAALRDDRVEDAVRLYERALDRDSTFVPAALGLAEAADQYNGAEQQDRGLALAWAARDRLGERDRAYLIALAGPRYPAPSTSAEQLAAWERAVVLAPDRAAAWSELGERLLYDGPVLGLRTARERAGAAFRRALEFDPEYAPALRNQVELAALAGDSATLRQLAAPDRLRAFGGNLAGYLRWRAATVTRDSAALRSIHDALPTLGAPSLRAIAMAAQHTGLGREEGERALRYLASRAALGTEQLDVLLAQHSLALNQGRPVLALDVTERLQDAQPGSHAHLRLRVLDALYAGGDSAAAVTAAGALARRADAPPEPQPTARALQLADVCVLAQWRVSGLRAPAPDAATVARVRAAITTLGSAPLPRVVIPVEVTPPACAAMLETMLAVAVQSSDARQRVEGLNALMLTGPAIGDARTYASLLVARLYERLGDPPAALVAIRQRAYLRGWPRSLATSLGVEARLALAVGDSTGALAATRRLLALRDDPEPALRAQVDSARKLVTALARRSGQAR